MRIAQRIGASFSLTASRCMGRGWGFCSFVCIFGRLDTGFDDDHHVFINLFVLYRPSFCFSIFGYHFHSAHTNNDKFLSHAVSFIYYSTPSTASFATFGWKTPHDRENPIITSCPKIPHIHPENSKTRFILSHRIPHVLYPWTCPPLPILRRLKALISPSVAYSP